jgi:hypothetical protein
VPTVPGVPSLARIPFPPPAPLRRGSKERRDIYREEERDDEADEKKGELTDAA